MVASSLSLSQSSHTWTKNIAPSAQSWRGWMLCMIYQRLRQRTKDPHFFRGVKLSTVVWGEGQLIQIQAVLVVAADLHDEATEKRNPRSPSTRSENIEHMMTNEVTRGVRRNANTKAGEITRRQMTKTGGDRSRGGNARDIEVEAGRGLRINSFQWLCTFQH